MASDGTTAPDPTLEWVERCRFWHDCSAEALRDEYRGSTHRLRPAPSINRIAPNSLRPGDFAVTANSVHTLAYLGDRQWIEADPEIGRVVIVRTPAPHNAWFDTAVWIMRWRALRDDA